MKNKKLIIGIIIALVVLVALIAGGIIIFNKAAIVEEVKENGEKIIDDCQVGELAGNTESEEEVKFDEEDLKEKIGIYLIYENFMQDYFVPNQADENVNIVDYANEAKVLIGYYLVHFNNPLSSAKPSEEQVRKAVEEYCGEHYEKYIDTAECWIAFDGNDTYDFCEAGDYEASGLCNSIESIEKTPEGKYTVTFIYSRPSESDYIDGNLDKVQKYRKQFTFIYHPDAKYTKYQLTEISFLKGEEV